jgi:N-ethylmaleimide reductase
MHLLFTNNFRRPPRPESLIPGDLHPDPAFRRTPKHDADRQDEYYRLTNRLAIDIRKPMAREYPTLPPQPTPRRLFEPVTMGRYRLRHRIVMAPLTRCRVSDPNIPNGLMAEYYRQRAGAALIITEATAVSEGAQGYWRTPGIYAARHLLAWEEIANAVHRQQGRIFMQLWHNGRVRHPDNVPWEARSVGPSAIAPKMLMMTPNGRQAPPVPESLTIAEIAGIRADFVLAARNAILAGMDGVELHAANGYIFEQFLNRSSNQRSDSYGGSMENRGRLLAEVIADVSEAIGPDRVGVRISPFGVLNDIGDPAPGEIYDYLLRAMDSADIAYLHIIRPVVSGNIESEAGRLVRDPVLDVRPRFRGRVIVAGGIEIAEAEHLIESGLADAVAFGRWFVANPDLPDRLRNGWPLNDADRATFYTPGREGYVDYPAFAGSPGPR